MNALNKEKAETAAKVAVQAVRAMLIAAEDIPTFGNVAKLINKIIQICDQCKCNKGASQALQERFCRLSEYLFSGPQGLAAIASNRPNDLSLAVFCGRMEIILQNAVTELEPFTKNGFIMSILMGSKPQSIFENLDGDMTQCLNELSTALHVSALNEQAKIYDVVCDIHAKVDKRGGLKGLMSDPAQLESLAQDIGADVDDLKTEVLHVLASLGSQVTVMDENVREMEAMVDAVHQAVVMMQKTASVPDRSSHRLTSNQVLGEGGFGKVDGNGSPQPNLATNAVVPVVLASPLVPGAKPAKPIKPTKIRTAALDAACVSTPDSSRSTDAEIAIATEVTSKSPKSWLVVHLLQSGIDKQLANDCELKLVGSEGFVSETDFAEFSPSDLHAAYLQEIGISGKWVRAKIIKLHRELYKKYTPPKFPAIHPNNSEMKFTCGAIPIEDVQALTSGLDSRHDTTSSRILLRGHFVHTSAEFGGYKTTKYHCLIKCAGEAVASAADSDETKAIQREFSMYEQVKEIARLKGCAATGCVACYHMHPSGHYLVLEAFGQDIRCLLAPNFKLAPQLAEAIVTAVAALHSLGVVHCDIKPHNILFEFGNLFHCVVKLCDLDGSRLVGDVCAAASLGTTQYESPEVFFASCAGETVTAALSMDMFSLGLVLWQVLSRSPYPPMSVEQLHECYSNQNELFSLVALPEPMAMYQPLLYSTLVLQPPHRRVTADSLFKNMRDMAVSKAHPGWHKARQENVFLKEKVSDKLDGLDKKLGSVLKFMQVRFDTLGGEVVTMAQALRREILLGREEQSQTLTSMKEATQDALEQLSEAQDSATMSSAEHTDQILSCIHSLQSRIGNNVAPGAGRGDASTREKEVEGLLRSVTEQLNAQFQSLSVEFQEHAKRQSVDAADSARVRTETMEMNHALSVRLQEVLKSIVTVQTEVVLLRQGQERLGVQVGRVLRENNAIQTMLRTLIAGTHAIPTYAIILPVVAKTWIKKADPMRLVRNKYRLYFLCSHTHQIAPCGPKGEGYKITVTKRWVRDAAPVLLAAQVVLKIALTAGGIPLPIPDLSSLLTSAALHVKFLDAALHLVQNPPDDHGATEFALDEAIGALDSVGVEEVTRHCEVIQGRGNQGMSLEEGTLKAYATIQSILTADSIDIALSSGLRQVTHPVSGKTAWVLDNDTVVQEFRASL